MGKLDFCKSDPFGFWERLFVREFGTYAPLNSNREEHPQNGFQVVGVDLGAQTREPFLRNRHPGPASETPGSGGIERPVDFRFTPDGRSLHVPDFGNSTANDSLVVACAHTGEIWRVTRC